MKDFKVNFCNLASLCNMIQYAFDYGCISLSHLGSLPFVLCVMLVLFFSVGIRQTSYTSSYIRSTIYAYLPGLYTRITRSARHRQTGIHNCSVSDYYKLVMLKPRCQTQHFNPVSLCPTRFLK